MLHFVVMRLLITLALFLFQESKGDYIRYENKFVRFCFFYVVDDRERASYKVWVCCVLKHAQNAEPKPSIA